MANKTFWRGLPAAGLLLALAACGDGNQVVLLADPDGHVGKIEVTSPGGARTLDQARMGTSIARAGQAPEAPELWEEERVRKTFGRTLDAMPPQPETYTLYFETGTADLTPESAASLPAIIARLPNWPFPRLVVVGHADAVGSDEVNLTISRQRAEAVRDLLVAAGVPAEKVEVSSHGKRNPLIKTPDGVAEPRNRRVSVTIQ